MPLLTAVTSARALLNLNGEFIDYCHDPRAVGGSIGIGFAIPSNMAQTLAQQLIQFGEIKTRIAGELKAPETPLISSKAFKSERSARRRFVSEVLPNSGSAKRRVKLT